LLPEALLWHELRGCPSGLRFRRRRSTGKYVHDFYCLDARLAIEVEGEAAAAAIPTTPDPDRADWLERAGIATLRVPAARLLDHARLAADEIIERARLRLPRSHPAGEAVALEPLG